MMQWILVFIGGGLGSMARFAFSRYLDSDKLGLGILPIPTFLANLVSCFILGILVNKYIQSGMSPDARLLLASGFCGGFSTFSTLSLEMFSFIQKGQPLLAFTYIFLSTIFGLIALYAGYRIPFT